MIANSVWGKHEGLEWCKSNETFKKLLKGKGILNIIILLGRKNKIFVLILNKSKALLLIVRK